MLDKLTLTTAATIQSGNTYSDIALNEIEQKHESTKISPINEITNTFLGSSSSTMFTNLHTIVSGSNITSTIYTDSSSTGNTITDALPFTSTTNEIIHQPV
ncbi:hypothetical protein LOAG_15674 [Loa loa]|uniref:Uncharacterized protein n=1 Tax=Loa loa TaxID=7209 RepID=A0A1S0TFC7_LOALO|nr:hypothetical protein LOAG_15674 [Loa loa]EFO12858.1 hypothetical protein LOAG_15674 [Loa loa]